MNKHTPTPWVAICDPAGSKTAMALVNTKAVSERRKVVAMDCTYSGKSYQEDCANARFIVTACNSYDKLRQSLQSARDLIERGNYTSAEAAVVLKEVNEVLGET